MTLQYLAGFANSHVTEALPGALPEGRNSPQQCPYGLYAEQISGTAFTAPRHTNRRSWTYRLRPGVAHMPFEPYQGAGQWQSEYGQGPVTPNQLRWSPLPYPDGEVDFVDGMITYGGSGQPEAHVGVGIHLYAATRSMEGRFFYNADGEMLIVPQEGRLRFETEMGIVEVEPLEIAVLPRGIRYRVTLPDGKARGYVLENYGPALRLPELGPIGANGLANARDFLAPVAWYEDVEGDFELIAKFTGGFWRASIDHSPLDVVGWHGTHYPYKYDLRKFNAIGSISFDHPDPSIFTVLTAPTDTAGVANMDFAVFAPRILAMENTFRPPWYHRNIASEFMGLIQGVYDAKAEGFAPGGASLHNCFTGHGPDADTFAKASAADTSKPDYLRDTMAFMFETRNVIRPTTQALQLPQLQNDYYACWQGLKKFFNPNQP